MMVPKMSREIHVRAGSAGRREFKTFLCPCPGSVAETRACCSALIETHLMQHAFCLKNLRLGLVGRCVL